jgi:hypothetical protein
MSVCTVILACLTRRSQHRPCSWHSLHSRKHTIGLVAFMSKIFNE